MPSPFPGMDPWLEAPGIFPDLHHTMITELKRALNAGLPAPYFAAAANRIWIDDTQNREPDVSVYGKRRPYYEEGAGSLAVVEEVGLRVMEDSNWIDPHEEPFIEIRNGGDNRLVTAIEILSLSNKESGSGRTSYRQKQAEMRMAGCSFVEIDLLRGGWHTTLIDKAELKKVAPDYAYHVCAIAAGMPGRLLYAAVRLEDRLPRIGIPLDAGVPRVPVDLQAVLDASCEISRYDRQIDYAKPCRPALSDAQRLWADAILREKGLKS